MIKQITLLILMFMFCLNVAMVSGADFDNVKDYEEIGKYGKITITNNFGFGSKLAEYTLLENTNNCLIDCFAEGTATLHNSGQLFSDLNFYKPNKDSTSIQNKILIEVTDSYEIDYDDTEMVCVNGKQYENKSYEQICTMEVIGSKKKTRYRTYWEEYNGDVLPPGNYEWRIEGKKDIDESIDWVGSAYGEEFTEWAWWNESFERKQTIIITERNNTELMNYSIYMNISYNTDMAEDFSDLRFLDSDETTELSYYIENYTTGVNATVWVKMASNITANSDKNIHMYYKNITGISTTSNFNNAFLHADDFEDPATLGNWNWSVAGCDDNVKILDGAFEVTETSGGSWDQCTVVPEGEFQYLNTSYEVKSNSYVNLTGGYILSSAGYIPFTVTNFSGWWAMIHVGGNNRFDLMNTSGGGINSTADIDEFDLFDNYSTSIGLYEDYFRKAVVDLSNESVRYELVDYGKGAENIEGWYGMRFYEGVTTPHTTRVNWWRVRPIVEEEPSYSIGFENSQTFNAYSYETAAETFTLNISSLTDGGIPTADLIYNGTLYPGTRTGSNPYIFTANIEILLGTGLGNKSFYWNITEEGSNFNSATYEQNIAEIFFAECNSTYKQAYLNLTVKDESNSSIITDATIPLFNAGYYLGSGAQVKNFTYTNNTGNQNYSFCFSPVDRDVNVDISLQYEDANGDYPQRTYQDLSVLTNASTNLTLYLLQNIQGGYTLFQVVNTADEVIEGVNVKATRVIDSSTVTVGEGFTSAAGTISFFLDRDFVHTFTFNKTGYPFYTTSFAPSESSYTVNIGGKESNVTKESYTRGITYSITPINSSLFNDTEHYFSFNLSSTYWDVEEFGFNIFNSDGENVGNDTIYTNGGTASTNYNVGNVTDYVSMNFYWVIGGGNYSNGTRSWYLFSSGGTNFSVLTFFKDLKLYMNSDEGLFGLDEFGLALIIFITIFLTVGCFSYKFGITSPAAIVIMIITLVVFFDFGLDLMSGLNPIGSIEHFSTLFVASIGIIYLISEALR